MFTGSLNPACAGGCKWLVDAQNFCGVQPITNNVDCGPVGVSKFFFVTIVLASQGDVQEDGSSGQGQNSEFTGVISSNFGPASGCYDHLDYANAATVWCAITPAGSYDPKISGHLILFDIDLVIEFPPGSTILIPSSVMWHANTSIQDNETCVLIAQYAAGGLFKYIDYGFATEKDAEEENKAEYDKI